MYHAHEVCSKVRSTLCMTEYESFRLCLCDYAGSCWRILGLARQRIAQDSATENHPYSTGSRQGMGCLELATKR